MQLNFQNFINAAKNNAAPQSWEVHSSLTEKAQKAAINDDFIKYKKNTPYIEKISDVVKNVAHVGFSSKKVEKIIKEGSTNEAVLALENYKKSSNSSSQIIGDGIAACAGLGSFWGIGKLVGKIGAMKEMGIFSVFSQKAAELGFEDEVIYGVKNIAKKVINFASSKKAFYLIGGLSAILAGGFAKAAGLAFGDKKYKLTKEEKNLPKPEKKALKKSLKKEWRKNRNKNILTGAINGIAAPLFSMVGIVGAPLWAISSFALRYKTPKNNDNTVKEDVKKNGVALALTSAAVMALMIKKGLGYKAFSTNINKVAHKLKGELEISPYNKSTNFNHILECILYRDDAVRSAGFMEGSTSEVINAMTKANIFSVKFRQISTGDALDDVTKALRENCPPSRTLEEAKQLINKFAPNDKYEVQKLLGVGTIAETYLAKDKNGKEVCIKILKEGINKDKILADKENFVQIIKAYVKKYDFPDDYEKRLLDALDNLADGILNEVDFKHEMQAAQKLAQYTKKANVVVPIEAKDGFYVMEKAKGASLTSVLEYASLKDTYNKISQYEGLGLPDIDCIKNELEEQIADFTAKIPELANVDISSSEMKKIYGRYLDVCTEQYDKVFLKGKIVHGDIHPGNVFVDFDALKKGKKNYLTLIDTGNTVDITAQQMKNTLKLSENILLGNTAEITSYALDGAKLPKGMTYEKATEIVKKELDEIFFGSDVTVKSLTNESVISIVNEIMIKNNIFPADVQLSLNKAKAASNASFSEIAHMYTQMKMADVANGVATGANASLSIAGLEAKKVMVPEIQRYKNMVKTTPKEIIQSIFNKNRPKQNSEEALTLKMKRIKMGVDGILNKIQDFFTGLIS